MFRPSLRRSSISLVVALSALTAAGCAATGAAPFLAFALSLGLVLFGVACAESHETRLDGSVDAAAGDGGTWEVCCKDHVVDTCFCPTGATCNFGWYTDCGDGTCMPEVDAVCPDGPGEWEPCCEDGVITTCFCPAGVACNYGMFEDCGDGTCKDAGESCADGA